MTFTQLQNLFNLIWQRSGQIGTTDTQMLINLGYKQFATLTDSVRGVVTLSTVAKQGEYDLPTALDKALKVWVRGRLCRIVNEDELYQGTLDRKWDVNASQVADAADTVVIKNYDNSSAAAQSTTTKKRILKSPIPTDAAEATAVNDAATMLAAATSVVVDSTSDFPVDYGDVIIESEVVHYGYKDATHLYGLIRGSEGTAAAIHADDKAITLRDIVISCTKIPADMSSGSDEPVGIDAQYHEAIVNYALSLAFTTKEKLAQAQYYQAKFDKMVTEYTALYAMKNSPSLQMQEWKVGD